MSSRLAILASALLLPAGPAAAALCAVDDVPAATLMLPYFEVDLDDAGGPTTLFSIGNADAAAAMTRVTLWSDLGVPVLWFYVELTGWDVQTINLRDVLAGDLPATDGRPRGQASIPFSFLGCSDATAGGPLPAAQVAHVRAWLTGQPSPLEGEDGLCGGLDYGDGLARGWVSVDLVTECSDTPPGPDYYGEELAHDNVLFGDFFLVDPSASNAWGESLVRLEAREEMFGPGDRTFYGSWVGGTGVDGREPLPTVWSSRFVIGPPFDGTDLIGWRDPGVPSEPFACGTPQNQTWFPLIEAELHIFDEQENWYDFVDPCTVLCAPEDVNAFVAQTNRIAVDGPTLPSKWLFGSLLVVFDDPTAPESRRQAWLGGVMNADDRFSVGLDATPLDGSCIGTFTTPDSQ